jgi:ABC-2 type transport system permease protein
MVLAALTYSSVIWVVLVVVGAITSRLSLAHVLTPRFGLMLLGSFLYMLISMSIALLACAITQKQNVITGVTNVVALGSSFLGGVFVPIEVLGEGVVRIGKVLPAYWYTTAVRAVGDAGELGTAPLHTYWQGMGIMTLMLGVLLGATLLVNKIRRQRGI